MPPTLALCLYTLFIGWLFWLDAKRRTGVSSALWIPLTWAFIIASRPISLWLAGTIEVPAGGLQDKLVDKLSFVVLLAAGLFVLARRRASWPNIIQHNKWLFAYLLFLGITVLWADEPFVSFKRWIKYFGNVVMVLVVFSEKDPGVAVRAFLARFAYLMVPLSVLLIKYYPSLSKAYHQWSFEPGFSGVALGKNMLGMTLFVCGLSMFWMLLEVRDQKSDLKRKETLFAYAILAVMTMWLLRMAQSSTALACTVLGSGLIFAMRFPAIRRQIKRLEIYMVGVVVLVVLMQASGAWGLFVKELAGLVGRDPTLHGRSEIWESVLNEKTNPLIGTGYYSFWSEERNAKLSEKYYYALGVAHNGYLETYLSGGLVALFTLFMAIVAAVRKIKNQVLAGSSFGALRLAFLILIAMYSLSESIFDRLGIVWLAFLLVVIEYPRKGESPTRVSVGNRQGQDTQKPAQPAFCLGFEDSFPQVVRL